MYYSHIIVQRFSSENSEAGYSIVNASSGIKLDATVVLPTDTNRKNA